MACVRRALPLVVSLAVVAACTGSASHAGNVPTVVLRDMEDVRVTHSAPLRDTYVKRIARQSF